MDPFSVSMWVWRNKKTGGFGLGRLYGHKSHAYENRWLGDDGTHEIIQVVVQSAPSAPPDAAAEQQHKAPALADAVARCSAWVNYRRGAQLTQRDVSRILKELTPAASAQRNESSAEGVFGSIGPKLQHAISVVEELIPKMRAQGLADATVDARITNAPGLADILEQLIAGVQSRAWHLTHPAPAIPAGQRADVAPDVAAIEACAVALRRYFDKKRMAETTSENDPVNEILTRYLTAQPPRVEGETEEQIEAFCNAFFPKTGMEWDELEEMVRKHWPVPPLSDVRAATDGERLEAALRFILDECDWEEVPDPTDDCKTAGGDDRIGKACRDALAAMTARGRNGEGAK